MSNINLLSQDNINDHTIRYPRITLSWNRINPRQDYAIEVKNVDRNSTVSNILNTDFDSQILYPTSIELWFYKGHEFKLGLLPTGWLEFGLGYYFYDCSATLFFKEEISATYLFTDGTSKTFSSNVDFRYSQRFRGPSVYVKFIIPIINHQKKGDEKGYCLNICPQYGFAMSMNKQDYSEYQVEYPVYPSSYETYSPHSSLPPVEFTLLEEWKLDDNIAKSYLNLFSFGLEFNYLKIFSFYIDYCYYSNLKKENIFLEHNFFQNASTTGTNVRLPGTITTMSTLKVGIAIQIPLRYK